MSSLSLTDIGMHIQRYKLNCLIEYMEHFTRQQVVWERGVSVFLDSYIVTRLQYNYCVSVCIIKYMWLQESGGL